MFDDRDDVRIQERSRAALHADLDRLLDARDSTTTETPASPGADSSGLTEAVLAARRLSSAVDGALVVILPHWEDAGHWAQDGSRSVAGWLRNHTGMARSSAGALRKTARLARSMPHVQAAAGSGELPASHIRQLTRACRPEVADLFRRDEETLVAAAGTLHADALRVLLHRWHLAALEASQVNEPSEDPDPQGGTDHLSIQPGFQGHSVIGGELSPEATAILFDSINAEIDTWHRDGAMDNDDRPRTQLQAQALLDIVRRGAIAGTHHGAPRPLVLVTTTLDALMDRAGLSATDRVARRTQIINGGTVSGPSIRRLLCDAELNLIVTDNRGDALFLGRAKRQASAAQVRSLVARSGGSCEWPGCSAVHHRCHAHHIRFWDKGGGTDLDNLALLCSYHHHFLHRTGTKLARGPDGLQFHTAAGQPISTPYRDAA